jgi:hypothetical protein
MRFQVYNYYLIGSLMLLVQMQTCEWDVAAALNFFFSGPSLSDSAMTRQAIDQPLSDRAISTATPASDEVQASNFSVSNNIDFTNYDSETDEGLIAAIRASLNDNHASSTTDPNASFDPVRWEAAPAPKSILRGRSEPNPTSLRSETTPISRLRSAPTHDERSMDSTKHRRMSVESLETRNSQTVEEKILADRCLRYDQDEEYQLSLAQDRAKDEQRRSVELQKRWHNPCEMHQTNLN